MIDVFVHVGGIPATWCKKFASKSWPRSVWATSGWNCTACRRRSTSSMTATGASGDEPVTTNPSGAVAIASPWLIQHVTLAGHSSIKTDEP